MEASKEPMIESFCCFGHFLGYFRSLFRSSCIQCIQMFPQGAYQVLAFISTVIGSFEIHTRTLGLLKGPAMQHICHLRNLLGWFYAHIEVRRVSNASKYFPQTTTRYCFSSYSIPMGSVKASEGPTIEHFCFSSHFVGLSRPLLRLLGS